MFFEVRKAGASAPDSQHTFTPSWPTPPLLTSHDPKKDHPSYYNANKPITVSTAALLPPAHLSPAERHPPRPRQIGIVPPKQNHSRKRSPRAPW